MMIGDTTSSLLLGQQLLYTSSVKQFFVLADLLRHTAALHPSRGIISGAPGIGKSAAAHMYLSWVKEEQQMDYAACTLITIMPKATMTEMMNTIAHRVSGSSERYSSSLQGAIQRVTEAILKFQVHLLIIDDADHLPCQHLELLGVLFKELPCALLLICQSRMLEHLKNMISFVDRVGIQQVFPSLTQKEVIDAVLPRLVLPRWSFDAQNERDILLGKELWTAVGPSFYRLRLTLEYAHHVAQTYGEPILTRETLCRTFQLMGVADTSSASVLESEKKEEE